MHIIWVPPRIVYAKLGTQYMNAWSVTSGQFQNTTQFKCYCNYMRRWWTLSPRFHAANSPWDVTSPGVGNLVPTGMTCRVLQFYQLRGWKILAHPWWSYAHIYTNKVRSVKTIKTISFCNQTQHWNQKIQITFTPMEFSIGNSMIVTVSE